jgi:hypothetical protein
VPNKPQQLLPFSTAKQANLLLNGHPLDSVKHEDINKTLRLQSTHDVMNHISIQIKSRWHNKTVSPTTTGISLSQETRGQLLTTRHQQDPRKKANVIG